MIRSDRFKTASGDNEELVSRLLFGNQGLNNEANAGGLGDI